MNATALVTDTIDRSPAGTFLRPGDINGAPRTAVHMALSRLARQRPDLIRVAPGVYWKGRPSRFGPVRPDAIAIARLKAGDRGVGPTGWLAANELGLSTQVPARPALAAVGRPPQGVDPVTFVQRSNVARVDLCYLDVALLEVLRAYPDYVDIPWPQLVDRIKDLAAQGIVHLDDIARVAARERSASLHVTLNRLLHALAPSGHP
jgi:hypothetical protein